ncbi:MAG: DUF2971 domain-containing protein [Mesorhizobium sp.]|uniref:DUF2971 domain-containing protein n=1 Tax=Mesorhizobium sp. TaxID=1871066 RepID=UPI000FE93792|nr:DUF2971 domain-containing protein [Mesorhizobium sp.]RWQ28466.1 MAG: DUF2971 domain-containing protein [Mesorhizobium sp.]TIL22522.1 MAG: DUF2971 domain-containing protein [Mesorhizobium sp.]
MGTDINYHEMHQSVPAVWKSSRIHFFKYMSAGTAKIVLANRTLRWSTPGTLNDPYDLQFDLQISADRSRVRPLALERLWEVFKGRRSAETGKPLAQLIQLAGLSAPQMTRQEFERRFGPAFDEGFERMMKILPEVNAEVRQQMQSSKVLCLTVDPQCPPMWAHYADNSRGVVLRFRTIPAFDSYFGLAQCVKYVTQPPQLISEDQLVDMFAGLSGVDVNGALDNLVFTKGVGWSYEQEWRISVGDGWKPGSSFEDLTFGRNELDGLIFGIKTSEKDRTEILSLLDKFPNVKLMEAARSFGGFQFEIRELNEQRP